VPEDVAVAGFDNLTQSRYAIPPLTTVNLQVREMARLAIEALQQSFSPGERDAMKEPHPPEPDAGGARFDWVRRGWGKGCSERSMVTDRQA